MKIIDVLFQKYAKNEEVFLKTEEVNELIKDCFSKVGKYGQAQEKNVKQFMRLADMSNRGKITKKDLFNLLWMALEPKAQNKASIN